MYLALAVLCCCIWIYLLAFRREFWNLREWSSTGKTSVSASVCAVIPARDEAETIGASVASLLAQTGVDLRVIVVDDNSTDGTAQLARNAAQGNEDRVTVLEGAPLATGWTGKLWALSQGVQCALEYRPGYLLLTDADIWHDPGNVAGLVAKAESDGLDLASLMVKLRCESFAERAVIPAFVFFFLKLYPPKFISDLDSKTAGAAGGCILIRPKALERIGGLAAIRSELIDDCALAAAVKQGGPIFLGLTRRTRSLRSYTSFAELSGMIARTAFTQLGYSAPLLAAALIGLLVTYVSPLLLLFAGGWPAVLGGFAWLLMTLAYLPAVRFYNQSPLWAAALPLIAVFYAFATVVSATRYWRGKGGSWKGRSQAPDDQRRMQ